MENIYANILFNSIEQAMHKGLSEAYAKTFIKQKPPVGICKIDVEHRTRGRVCVYINSGIYAFENFLLHIWT